MLMHVTQKVEKKHQRKQDNKEQEEEEAVPGWQQRG